MTAIKTRIKNLECALDVFKREGWQQGAYSDNPFFSEHPGRCCSVGAVRHCATENPIPVKLAYEGYAESINVNWSAIYAVCRDLATTINPGWDTDDDISYVDIVIKWNDQPGRTVEEVEDVFKRTVARLKSEAGA